MERKAARKGFETCVALKGFKYGVREEGAFVCEDYLISMVISLISLLLLFVCDVR